ncbi:hypothetical protein ScPMuIL_009017 [Solemya velum]
MSVKLYITSVPSRAIFTKQNRVTRADNQTYRLRGGGPREGHRGSRRKCELRRGFRTLFHPSCSMETSIVGTFKHSTMR